MKANFRFNETEVSSWLNDGLLVILALYDTTNYLLISETVVPLEDIGMEYLLNPEKEESDVMSGGEGQDSPSREITDIAAAAQRLQPTGYTLETTEVSYMYKIC